MLPYWISREWEIKQNNNEGKSLVTTLNQYLDCSQYSIDVYGDIRLAPESLTVNTHRHTERVQLAQGKEEVKMPKKRRNFVVTCYCSRRKEVEVFQFANGNQLECHTLCGAQCYFAYIEFDLRKSVNCSLLLLKFYALSFLRISNFKRWEENEVDNLENREHFHPISIQLIP